MTLSGSTGTVKRLRLVLLAGVPALCFPLKRRCLVLLSELLDAPELGLRLLHLAGGVLDRPIGRLVTTDLLEPGRYLNGGGGVLAGVGLWRANPQREGRVGAVGVRGAT